MEYAQVGPIDIGAQVFAADGAGCGFFDGGAAFGGDWPTTLNPLVNRWRLNAEQSSHCRLTTSDLTGRLNGFVFHNGNYKAQPYIVSIGIA